MHFKYLTSVVVLQLMFVANTAQAHPLGDVWDALTQKKTPTSELRQQKEKTAAFIKSMKRSGDLFLVEKQEEVREVSLDELSITDLSKLNTAAAPGKPGSVNASTHAVVVKSTVILNQDGEPVKVNLGNIGGRTPGSSKVVPAVVAVEIVDEDVIEVSAAATEEEVNTEEPVAEIYEETPVEENYDEPQVEEVFMEEPEELTYEASADDSSWTPDDYYAPEDPVVEYEAPEVPEVIEEPM